MALEEFNHFFQESILSDLENGVNPQSKKRVFHITRDNMYDPNNLIPDDMIFKTFKPRVPSFAANTKDSSGFASSGNGKYKEDGTTPRICVSPSIEGCLNSLRSYLNNSDNPRRVKQEFNKGVWYVYTPLQDLSNYNIKSNLDIVKNGLVWDAKYTKETWILEDATMVLYGIIKVDDVSDPMTKQNSDIRKPGTHRLRENMEGRFNFSWHWVKSNKTIMRDKRIADIIKNAREKQSNDKTFKPDIPKTGKRKQAEIDRDKRIASAKEYNTKSASYEKQIRDFNIKLSKMIDDINSGKSGISEKEFRVFWDSGKKLRKEWKKFLEEEDDTADMFPDEQLNHWLNIIKQNKSKSTIESYIDEDDTTGTSEFDEPYNDDPNDCYCESFTNTKSVSILYKRWSTKNGEQYKPIAKFWDIVEKHVKASKLQGYGTDWTGYGTDFLYGIIFKNGNIPKEVIDDVKKAFPDMIVDNSFSIPSSFEETYSGDTENIDSLYDKIWSKGFLSHELEEFTDDGKCTIRVSYKNKVSQESTIPRSNEVYTKDRNIEKINKFPFDKVYFGSPNKIPSTMKLDGPLFVSPYPGIASIFSVRPQNLQKYGVPRGIRCNRAYDEWDRSLIDTVLQKPLRELHVRIQAENINIKPTTELVSGYLYTIDVTPEIKDHIYQSSKMNKVFEFCIDKMDSVTFSDVKKINIRMTVTGENKPVQEAYDAVTGEEIPIDHAYTMDEMKARTYTEEELSEITQEAKLPSKDRNKLPDSDFALVYTDANGKKIRKYPIHDEAHCKAAAHMFPRGVPLKYKATVARKILRRAHKFGIDTSGWKNLNKFKESD